MRIWVQKDIPALGASSGLQNLGTEGFQRREKKGGIGTMVEFHWQAETEWGLEWKAELRLKEEKADCSRISGTSAEARSGAAQNGATSKTPSRTQVDQHIEKGVMGLGVKVKCSYVFQRHSFFILKLPPNTYFISAKTRLIQQIFIVQSLPIAQIIFHHTSSTNQQFISPKIWIPMQKLQWKHWKDYKNIEPEYTIQKHKTTGKMISIT